MALSVLPITKPQHKSSSTIELNDTVRAARKSLAADEAPLSFHTAW